MNWIKSHKLSVFLLLVIVLLFGKSLTSSLFGISTLKMSAPLYNDSVSYEGLSRSILPIPGSTNPEVPLSQRKVTVQTDLSLLVKNVRETSKSIKTQAESVGGFMVNSSADYPEGGATGYISVRVPTAKLDAFLETLRTLAVRVVSENISGTDVTDQYTDIESRLTTLTHTKATFEEILRQAKNVDEILRVQQSIFQVQDQIDSLKGQKNYLEDTTATSLVSVNLATDELSLPYAPAQPWRPSVIFKTAVRSLLTTLRGLGTAAIWIGVYSVFWLPALALIRYFSKRANPPHKPA
ncbi:MAG: hypothetical protein G01um101416_744 [Microgenomates group bacterium Gr01-1014_16]|nr:MAG: hypothetical protein G01um101416_744 [Microgenomates group bacterium Gr01-1014_16]